MSNHPAPRPAADRSDRPARPAPTYPQVSTDRPTATFPTGWQACPSGYLPATPATAARLQREDATPTGAFPTRRPRPEGVGAPQPDAASLSHGGAGARAVYHAAPTEGEQLLHEGGQPDLPQQPIQDMWRPGALSRPSMRWHPSLMQLAIGAALAVALLASAQLLALDGIASARQAAIERGRGAAAVPSQPAPEPPSKAVWTVHGTDSPYDRTDPSASPLDLPRCTTAPDTPLPCLATVSPDSRRVVVLEEDASLTGLDRR